MIRKPKHRSKLRLYCGRQFYRMKRHVQWLTSDVSFAGRDPDAALPHTVFGHRTPLLRKLKDVEMELQHNKVHNLKIAVPRVHGLVLRPGETFSYWRAIGKITKRKGYRPGMVLELGHVTAGTGGGLCQLSNLIFWMTLHTPLTVTERHRHGFDVFPDESRTQPFGSGATCYHNYIDLCIRNDTPHTFRLEVEVGEHDLVGRWVSDWVPDRSYEVYEAEHRIETEFWGGYSRHNKLRRRVLSLGGVEVADEPLIENHAIMMYTPFIENA